MRRISSVSRTASPETDRYLVSLTSSSIPPMRDLTSLCCLLTFSSTAAAAPQATSVQTHSSGHTEDTERNLHSRESQTTPLVASNDKSGWEAT
eukprot:3033966-Rhodomonas_salina.4